MSWYPEPKPVPAALDTDDLHLEMLAPQHVDLDLDALLSSWPRLQVWSGGSWPHAGFTRDENMRDMVMHRDEFLAREAFAYTVLSGARDRCEGCIYIEPVDDRDALEPNGGRDALPGSTAQVTWWVRDDALERGLDRQLIAGLVGWFRTDWEFDAVMFRTRAENDHDIAVLESAGLDRYAAFDGGRHPGKFYLYRAT